MLFNGIHRRMNHALLVRKRWNSIGTPMPYARLCALDENLSSSVVQGLCDTDPLQNLSLQNAAEQ